MHRTASGSSGSSRRSAALEIHMTTPSLKPSTGFTKPKLFTVAGHSAVSKLWNLPRWNGWTGSTIEGCWNPSAIFRPPRLKKNIMPCWTNDKRPHNLNKTVSGNPGAVKTAICFCSSVLLELAHFEIGTKNLLRSKSYCLKHPTPILQRHHQLGRS